MRRILRLAMISSTLALSGGRATFAVGGANGGRGYAAPNPGHAGNPTDDSASPLSHNYGMQPAGLGTGNAIVTPLISNSPTDKNYLSTGAKAPVGGGIGYAKSNLNGRYNVDQNIHGKNSASEVPGGRGF